MIDDISSDEFFKYLKKKYIFSGQEAAEEAIKKLLKEREKFFGTTNITNWTINKTFNRISEEYNRKVEFLSREKSGVFDRIYLGIEKING
jgi:hypothetical protein